MIRVAIVVIVTVLILDLAVWGVRLAVRTFSSPAEPEGTPIGIGLGRTAWMVLLAILGLLLLWTAGEHWLESSDNTPSVPLEIPQFQQRSGAPVRSFTPPGP
ncbi:MAG: hypothetical protein HQL51_07345 [Magnetococcales bacterium]|nr:hypothetical protein [Magnetococcales bacterium]